MTLPSSGQISLNDIQNEFGGSNPIALSEYYSGGSLVASGTTGADGVIPTSGTISTHNFYGASAYIPSYWLGASAYGSSAVVFGFGGGGLAIDSAGNPVAKSGSTGMAASGISKIGKTGAFQWEYYMAGYGTGDGNGGGVGVDSSDYIYDMTIYCPYWGYQTISKLSPSGTVQWQYNCTQYSSASNFHGAGGGNLFFMGASSGWAGGPWQLHAFNTSGTMVWSRAINCGGWSTGVSGVQADSSGNSFYAYADYWSNCSGALKYNSSGVCQYAVGFGSSGDKSIMDHCPSGNNDGNSYVTGNSYPGSSTIVIKLNSSGGVVWARQISGIYSGYSCTSDTAGNVYIAGGNMVAKWNSSGTLQWQLQITALANISAALPSFNNVKCVGTEIVIAGTINDQGSGYMSGSGGRGVIFRLPQNGSKTGTWSNSNMSNIHIYASGYSESSYSPPGGNTAGDQGGGWSFTGLSSQSGTSCGWAYTNI